MKKSRYGYSLALAAIMIWTTALPLSAQVQQLPIPDLRENPADQVRFLGSIGTIALIRAASPNSTDGPVLWETDGETARVVDESKRYPSLMMSDGETLLFRSGASFLDDDFELWTYDGSSVGSAQDFFGAPLKPKAIHRNANFEGDLLFTIVDQPELNGLWRRNSDGSVRVASVGDEIIVVGSVAYILADIPGRVGAVFIYDGADLKYIGDAQHNVSSVNHAVVGNTLLLAEEDGESEIVAFRDGAPSQIEGRRFPLLGARLNDDGYLYFVNRASELWRTDGETFELVVDSEPPVRTMNSQDGVLYLAAYHGRTGGHITSLRNGVETELKTVGPNARVLLLPGSPNGQFVSIDGQIYEARETGLRPIAEEKLSFFGWVGDYMLVQKQDEPGIFSIRVSGSSVDAEDETLPKPEVISLDSYPNPATSQVTIGVRSADSDATLVEVRDVLGRLVVTLHEGRLAAGEHAFDLDVRTMPGGVYFLRASTPETTITQSIVVSGGQ